MESFVVSARKYRPLGFEEVVGQEHITTTLKNAIDHNKLAQAMLFCGPRGVGKTTCARIVARMINGFEEKAEEEALHLIAQKADGALRDGLSIFDLMVTFSSGHQVTFKDVLNNLHILDYDYYFNVVDGLLAENATQPLILLDEILRKGFDGHNLLSGLSEHLRNLLVSQDSRTVTLMEVPDSTKKKYVAQANATSPSLLLSRLSIANQFDLNSKGSPNQRLTVELALMKMANVNAPFKAPDADDTKVTAEPAALKKKVN